MEMKNSKYIKFSVKKYGNWFFITQHDPSENAINRWNMNKFYNYSNNTKFSFKSVDHLELIPVVINEDESFTIKIRACKNGGYTVVLDVKYIGDVLDVFSSNSKHVLNKIEEDIYEFYL